MPAKTSTIAQTTVPHTKTYVSTWMLAWHSACRKRHGSAENVVTGICLAMSMLRYAAAAALALLSTLSALFLRTIISWSREQRSGPISMTLKSAGCETAQFSCINARPRAPERRIRNMRTSADLSAWALIANVLTPIILLGPQLNSFYTLWGPWLKLKKLTRHIAGINNLKYMYWMSSSSPWYPRGIEGYRQRKLICRTRVYLNNFPVPAISSCHCQCWQLETIAWSHLRI